jgi:Flp pilus assembly protein CpaB
VESKQSAVGGGARRGVTTRLSAGHVVMLLAGALGVLLTLSVLRDAGHTRPVLAAARDLAPGTIVDDGAVRVVRVHVDGMVAATLYGANQLAAVRGRVAVGAIRAGSLLTADDIRAVGDQAAARAMSFSIARAQAVDGNLARGDAVDIIAVDHDSGHSEYVMTGALVLGVSTHGAGALSGASDDVTITIQVDPQTAPRVAAALATRTVTLVRSTGAAPIAPGSP